MENTAAPMAVALQLGHKVVAVASEGTKLCLYADGQLLPQQQGLADGFNGSFALLHRGSEEAWSRLFKGDIVMGIWGYHPKCHSPRK